MENYDFVIRALGERDKNAREIAARTLIMIGKPVVPALTEALRNQNVRVRQMAAVALREIADKKAVEPLIQALNDRDSGVRGTATEALINIGKPSVKPLIQALKDENKDVRLDAVIALGGIGDKHAVEPLKQTQQDKDKVVRAAAEKALQYILG
jgi:HEAT repeat protein